MSKDRASGYMAYWRGSQQFSMTGMQVKGEGHLLAAGLAEKAGAEGP